MTQIKFLLLQFFIFIVIFIFIPNKINAQEFQIINYSNQTIASLYISPTSDIKWGDDLFGEQMLEPNYQYTMQLEKGCGNYDVKFVNPEGEECIRYEVYLCNNIWEIYDDDFNNCEGY